MTQSNRFTREVGALAETHVLVVGDIMLDRFITGAVERVSPEAPIPVLRVGDETLMPGGAGNVAANLVALGGRATLVGVVGDDDDGRALLDGLNSDRLTVRAAVDAARPTTVKIRYVAQGQQLLRADREVRQAIDEALAQTVLQHVDDALPEAGAVVLSDYGKGVLTPAVLQQVIAKAAAQGVPVVVDPNGADYARYRGAAYLSPNRAELAQAGGETVETREDVLRVAAQVMEASGIGAMLVTQSEAGLSLIPRSGDAAHFSAEAREVFDVSGAGDTVVATFAAGLAAGVAPDTAAALANTAAGIVVTKSGTAVVTAHEIIAHVHEADLAASDAKIRTLDEALRIAAGWRERGLRIGFTNGAFDLLHPGHIASIAQARAHCDRLIVALNSDASVRGIKGPSRPIQTETARAMVLGALEQVDLVVVFDADTPLELIKAVRPDVLVKGGDYTVDQIVGADVVQSYGGKVVVASFLDGHSTTRTVARMAG